MLSTTLFFSLFFWVYFLPPARHCSGAIISQQINAVLFFFHFLWISSQQKLSECAVVVIYYAYTRILTSPRSRRVYRFLALAGSLVSEMPCMVTNWEVDLCPCLSCVCHTHPICQRIDYVLICDVSHIPQDMTG